MRRPLDRLPKTPTKAEQEKAARILGHHPERLSTYFNFERDEDGSPLTQEQGARKARLAVTRLELLAILTQHAKGIESKKWYNRLWRFLSQPRGSGPLKATPPTQGEIARGEAMPEARLGG